MKRLLTLLLIIWPCPVTLTKAGDFKTNVSGLPWKDPIPQYRKIDIEKDRRCQMQDGTALYHDVYRPRTNEDLPVLLMRLPYDKNQAENITYAHPEWYARHGYIVVVQDNRGRYTSEGAWYPFLYEAGDGVDTFKCLKKLPGSNGKIAMYGFSYSGAAQFLASIHRPEGLQAIMPAFTGSNYYEGWTYRGGAFQHSFAQSWTVFLAQDTAKKMSDFDLAGELSGALGSATENYWIPPQYFSLLGKKNLAPYYFDWLKHDTYCDYWKRWSIYPHYSKINVPGLHIGGWYDIFLNGTIENFTGLQKKAATTFARKNQKLVIGPWLHMPWFQKVGKIDFGPNARNVVDALQVLWANKYLKGETNQLDNEPPVAIFVMGDNQWRFEKQWPLERTIYKKYYLHSQGRANSLNGNGTLNQEEPKEENSDIIIYDPSNPVMSIGGTSCCINWVTPMGVFDQRSQQFRNEVLVYTSKPLEEAIEVTGPIEMELYATSSVEDIDFTAMLCDVYPDGKSMNISHGIIRARFRKSLENPTKITPGEVYKYNIILGATSNVFKKHHRIRVAISNSNFPHYDRNFNNARPLIESGPHNALLGTQRVLHDARHPSHILLPIIPRQ